MVHHWSRFPTFLGMPLQQGVMWVAEINGLIGFGFFMDSNIKLGLGRSRTEVTSYYGGGTQYTNYTYVNGTIYLYILPLIVGLLQLVLSIMLGVGAAKGTDCLVLPWIIFYSIQTVILGLLGVIWSIVSVFTFYLPAPISIFSFIATVIYVEVMRYSILGAISLRWAIQNKQLTPNGSQPPNVQNQHWVPQSYGQPPQLGPQLSTMPPGYQWTLQPDNSQMPSHPANGMQMQWGPQSSPRQTGPDGVSSNLQQNSEQHVESKRDGTMPHVHM